jgi:aryl-alcohol dehydrogenase-like predicted oxidoreductase
MIEAVKAGKVRHVGVSNFSAAKMRRIADRLARSNIPLAANEVHYSLLSRKAESNGVLDACRELGASLVAYFPLARGRLTRPPAQGKAGALETLQKALTEVAEVHRTSPSQVALNWLLARDPLIIPIPGASKAKNAQQNIAALDWSLTANEFAAIDAASASWRRAGLVDG